MLNLELFNVDTFRAWLDKQPGDRAFDYCDPTGCLIASYIIETGIYPKPNCCAGFWREDGALGPTHQFPAWAWKLDQRLRDELPNAFTIEHVRELLRLKDFTVNVTRISTSTKTFTIKASCADDAKSAAVDLACNEVFSEKDASYEAEVV